MGLTTFKRRIANTPRYVPVYNTSTYGNCIAFFITRDKALLINTLFSHYVPHRLVHLTFVHFVHVTVFIDYYRIIIILLLINFAPVTYALQPQTRQQSRCHTDALNISVIAIMVHATVHI